MNDEPPPRASPLDKITESIQNHMRDALDREHVYPNPKLPSVVQLKPVQDEPPPYSPKNEDVPRAGELSSQVFNDLTTRIVSEQQEAVETLITDIVNRRAFMLAQIDKFKMDTDNNYGELESFAKKQQERMNVLADNVRKKVKEDTEEMIALSNRLREFADSINSAHAQFFKE